VTGLRVGIESGQRRVFAVALDWPGWARAGRHPTSAIEALAAYADRYRVVADMAELEFPKTADRVDVVEELAGNATTDFGAPNLPFSEDDRPVTATEAERIAALVRASWRLLDEVAARTPAELRKGPRGGGRDRDKMLGHVLGAEVEYGRKLDLERWKPELASPEEIARRREAIVDALALGKNGAPRRPGGWTTRVAARRIAWHALDHAWEMEDRTP
jgi:hypothetical protein